MLQLHLSDQQFNSLLRCVLYQRLDGNILIQNQWTFTNTIRCTTVIIHQKSKFSLLMIWYPSVSQLVQIQCSYIHTYIPRGLNSDGKIISEMHGKWDQSEKYLLSTFLWTGDCDFPLIHTVWIKLIWFDQNRSRTARILTSCPSEM